MIKKYISYFLKSLKGIRMCFLLSSLLIFVICFPQPAKASEINEFTILGLVNKEREGMGIPSLSMDPLLVESAKMKAEDMVEKDYWSHISPEGTSPWYFISASGYEYVYAGENLARGYKKSESVIKGWLNSDTHRNNLLSPHYKDTGIAVVSAEMDGKDTILVVQLFAQKNQRSKILENLNAKLMSMMEIFPSIRINPLLVES